MTKYVIKAPIKNITADSRQVENGSLFIAYPGSQGDGRDYIADAIKQGAIAVIWDDQEFEWNLNWNIKNIAIPHLRMQAGHIASQFFKKPSSQLWMVGVTGTNGKTTVTHWISQCFNYLDKKTAVIGTLGNGFLSELSPTLNTTPGPIEIQRYLAKYLNVGAQAIAMEVSSHGLDQGRLNGVHFDVAVFTNLSRDHLDYHETMEAYASAKRQFFEWDNLKASVINIDDKFGADLERELSAELKNTLTYGIHQGEVRASNIVYGDSHFTANIKSPYGTADIKVNQIGEFNVYNVLAVLSTLLVSDVAFEQAIEAISQITAVAGRMQIIGGGNKPLVVVDYAHTPDALEKVLNTLKAQAKSKIMCVFGCGGNRDKGKRAQMGKIASSICNALVITSDNPRDENPKSIINDVLEGVNGNYLMEVDRAKAIAIAIASAKVGDIVLIAGKGHEEYQEIDGVKHYFSDLIQAEIALEKYVEGVA
jgi:UDP-N-acetylmuramoyl-L-alanyl-D-glutamate--2,6-diaminopimelate ligase